MNRTVTALYETQADAEKVRDALVAAKLGDHVEITDESTSKEQGKAGGIGGWLSGLFGGHHDHHLYAEGLRRGHILLTAKVDDLNETRAAEIMDAAAPMSIGAAERSWRAEGWAPPMAASTTTLEPARTVANVRVYTF